MACGSEWVVRGRSTFWCKKNIFGRKIIPVAGISPEKTTGGGVAGGVERERKGVCVFMREREMRKIKTLLVFILFLCDCEKFGQK